MADTDRIKRNLGKMIDQGAPESDIGQYLQSEGFNSVADWRRAIMPSAGVQDYEPQGYTENQKLGRGVGLAAQGFNDAVANAVGAPVDAVTWLANKLGAGIQNPIGGSENLKKGIDYVASLPGKVGLTTEGAPVRMEPNNRLERTLYQGGEGAGNALAIAIPSGLIGQAAPVGSVLQGVASALGTQPITQAVAGATQGAVTGYTNNPLLGIAAGASVPILRAAASPIANRLTPQEARLAAAAEREGIPLTPAQAMGNPTLQTVERTMESLPGSSGPMKARFGEQRQAFNSAVLSRAGLTADEASPDVIQNAFNKAGVTFDSLAQRTVLSPDRQFAQDIYNTVNDYGRRLDTNIAPVFKSYIEDLQPLLQAINTPGVNPQIAGDVYGRIRSDIGDTIRANSSNPKLQRALGSIQTALDDLMERSTSGALRNEWKDARREYQALMTIDTAMKGGTQTDRIRADIPLNALRSAVVQADPRGFSRGRGQLNELSRIGDFLASRVPDSGTPARLAVSNPLMWPVIGGYNVGARLYNTPFVNDYLTGRYIGPADLQALYASQLARQGIAEAGQGDNALLNQRPAP